MYLVCFFNLFSLCLIARQDGLNKVAFDSPPLTVYREHLRNRHEELLIRIAG